MIDKSTKFIDHTELKSVIIYWLKSHGTNIPDDAIFSIDSNGNVTITSSVEINYPPGSNNIPVVDVHPVVALTPGHAISQDPPFSCTGKSTMFGLNWDGSIDTGDNGQGFFGPNTRNETLIGASIPREILLFTFLEDDSWIKVGIDEAWKANSDILKTWVSNHKPLLTIDSSGNTLFNVPLVDAGPDATVHNSIDLTYLAAHKLNTKGDALATYSISVNGQLVEIKGWDFKNQKVIGS